MTIERKLKDEALEYYRYLMAGKEHEHSCCCPACLYSEYKAPRPGTGKGRKYSKISFFMEWLIHFVKLERLKENGLFKTEYFDGRKVQVYKPSDIEKAPYIKITKNILDEICDETDDENILNYINYQQVYRKRTSSRSFFEVYDELCLRKKRRFEKKLKIPNPNRKALAILSSAQKVSDYIRRFPNTPLSQRNIMRHFSNKTVAWLSSLRPALEINYRIDIFKKGKATYYLYDKEKLSKQAREFRQALKQIKHKRIHQTQGAQKWKR